MKQTNGQKSSAFDPGVFQLSKSGQVFDLSSGWWPGMPLAPGHPPFQVLTLRTPMGERNQADLAFLEDNSSNFGFISELLSFCAHSGTHVDALAHITVGENDEWHGGFSANKFLGDSGPLNHDASELPPYICRGVLIDAPAALGVETLSASQAVDSELIKKALDKQGTELRKGDAIQIRTGMMKYWPHVKSMEELAGAGMSLDGAQYVAQFGPSIIGADTPVVEMVPSLIPGEPQPVHRLIVHDLGIPLMEWVHLEEVSKAMAYEFLFICIPIPIKGATGSLVRPLAII